ncbi:MAG: hypothetical protein QOG52_1319 [Frankiaceae bacterium]|jgi:hypothetical protein|nr:hypothetical protein [Frankiaceae bacterium]MDQ1714450.1 hypothetical protein [Frankiaceae bacterium]MDQ1724291.1 hypothetical protein [Frankiaceae bacterium]
MAQRVQVLLVCDVHEDDTPGSQTVTFALDGASYEIDLCNQHVAELHESFGKFIASARRTSAARGRANARNAGGGQTSGRRGGSDRQRTQDIRQWARTNGLNVNERGRIPAEIVAQYESAGR